jgi:hypothetical protein
MSNRARRLTAAGATSLLLVLGAASTASAQTAPDQHSGGESPNEQTRDPGTNVGGNTVTRGGGLPVTGGDVAGALAMGMGAIAIGSTAVVASRRRTANALT